MSVLRVVPFEEPGDAYAKEADPANPFHTQAYAKALVSLGWRASMLVWTDGTARTVTAAFRKPGPLGSILAIPSAPGGAPPAFWDGVCQLAQASGALTIAVGSHGSTLFEIPPMDLAPPVADLRHEWHLEAPAGSIDARLWPSHLRAVQAARSENIRIVEVEGHSGVRIHYRLARSAGVPTRGVSAAGPVPLRRPALERLHASGALIMYQARSGPGTVLASLAVLRAPKAAYLHSLGYTSAGRQSGAVHLLVASVVEALAQSGVRHVNLGEADESQAWMETLKAGFGARCLALRQARFAVGSGARRKLATVVTLVRGNPLGLVRYLAGHLERYVVFVAPPRAVAPPVHRPELTYERLTNDRLESLSERHPEIQRHVERARSVGFNDAYAFYANGMLAHISWMVPAHHDAKTTVRNLHLRPGEVEIGPCTTLPKFRGSGIYPYVIRTLCGVAAREGVERVLMITGVRNVASQRGIVKAGLTRRGTIYRLLVPWASHALTLRGHRLSIWLRGLATARPPDVLGIDSLSGRRHDGAKDRTR